jgi:hypothetical protein
MIGPMPARTKPANSQGQRVGAGRRVEVCESHIEAQRCRTIQYPGDLKPDRPEYADRGHCERSDGQNEQTNRSRAEDGEAE